jgi:hypothetical protein
VKTVEGVSRFCGVIERAGVQMPEISIDSCVLDVARHALGDGTVDSACGGDAVGDGLVTCQAPVRRDSSAGLMALLALGAFERLMRLGQSTR